MLGSAHGSMPGHAACRPVLYVVLIDHHRSIPPHIAAWEVCCEVSYWTLLRVGAFREKLLLCGLLLRNHMLHDGQLPMRRHMSELSAAYLVSSGRHRSGMMQRVQNHPAAVISGHSTDIPRIRINWPQHGHRTHLNQRVPPQPIALAFFHFPLPPRPLMNLTPCVSGLLTAAAL